MEKTEIVANQPYDESLEVSDSEEIPSVSASAPRQTARGQRSRQQPDMSNNSREEKEQQDGGHGWSEEEEEDDDDADDSDETESDDDDPEPGSVPKGTYDPEAYNHLFMTDDIRQLFQYITRYSAQNIELENKLKPFIPDFIPAVGDIDAFLKVPRPDGRGDDLGLLVLDEPCTRQSDPFVLSLWLPENARQQHNSAAKVKSIENPEENHKAVDSWIEDISDLHRSKAPATVHYTRPMPDIDTLMQEWPAEVEELLGSVRLPTADLDCSLAEYAEIICGILDIPVYKSRVQSLHVLFTLYSEFRNSQHFKVLAQGQRSEAASAPGSATGNGEIETSSPAS